MVVRRTGSPHSPGGERRRMLLAPVSSPGSNGCSCSRPTLTPGCPITSSYQFSCSAADGKQEKILVADDYAGAQIDWYQLDVDRSRQRLGDAAMPSDGTRTRTLSMVPVPATFGGMPNSRWWTFEEGPDQLR